jgi:hypothetical protein
MRSRAAARKAREERGFEVEVGVLLAVGEWRRLTHDLFVFRARRWRTKFVC